MRSALQELDDHFGHAGLLLHPGEVSSGHTKALGPILDGGSLCVQELHRIDFTKCDKPSGEYCNAPVFLDKHWK